MYSIIISLCHGGNKRSGIPIALNFELRTFLNKKLFDMKYIGKNTSIIYKRGKCVYGSAKEHYDTYVLAKILP